MLGTVFIISNKYLIACYFNSLIQSYYYIPDFTKKILISSNTAIDQLERDPIRSSNINRHSACGSLVYNLSALFARFALSNKKYTEPS